MSVFGKYGDFSIIGEYVEKYKRCQRMRRIDIGAAGENAERMPAYSPTKPNKQNFAMSIWTKNY